MHLRGAHEPIDAVRLSTCYSFIQKHYLQAAELWAEVSYELQVFRGLLLVLHSEWWYPWNRR